MSRTVFRKIVRKKKIPTRETKGKKGRKHHIVKPVTCASKERIGGEGKMKNKRESNLTTTRTKLVLHVQSGWQRYYLWWINRNELNACHNRQPQTETGRVGLENTISLHQQLKRKEIFRRKKKKLNTMNVSKRLGRGV